MNTPHNHLATALLAAVRAQGFGQTPDNWNRRAAVRHFPSIDLAVAAFKPGEATRWANVLFSREHPQGLAASIAQDASALRQVRFDKDQTDARKDSVVWATRTQWSQLSWRSLHSQHDAGAVRFVAPYPASLLKLMVAVGVGLAVDGGLCAWPDALDPMITVSDNDATDTCVALLHRVGLLRASTAPGFNGHQPLNAHFAAHGLPTLQVNDTTARGGWRNGDGSGVGHIHMTAWDSMRLLWLLDAAAPPAPWLTTAQRQAPLLKPATRDRLREVLSRQQLDEILSSGSLRRLPGWVSGGPDAPAFAHKTGTTDNYAADAGIVSTPQAHYIVAVLTSLGQRYAPCGDCATTWRMPALGRAVYDAVKAL